MASILSTSKSSAQMNSQALLVSAVAVGAVGGLLLGRSKRVQSTLAGLLGGGGGEASAAVGKRSVEDLVRENIKTLTPYRCARDDYEEGVLLDANENSIGATVAKPPDQRELNRYPCPYQWELKQLIAKHRNIAKEQIFLGVGSDEAIDMMMRIFCVPRKDTILITPPTYGMYGVCAKVNDVEVIKSPLDPSFDVDLEALFADVRPSTKLLFLCSPGNPTAKSIPLETIEAVLNDPRYDGMVVVDEAYVDFSTVPSACCLVDKYPKLIVLQTLSKAFGLAGIRLGMAISQESTIQYFNNVKAPYSVNKLTAEMAIDAFNNLPLLKANIQTILDERVKVAAALEGLPYVSKVHHSDTNFLLFVIPKAKEIYKSMAEAGVVTRYRGTEMHCDGCIRVTIGTPAENDEFLALLQKTAKEFGVC